MSSISNTARSGNVLVLLDLYTSGFASSSASPTIPMLTSLTMHTLYAISLLIYSINSFFNWLYLYNLLQGFLTSFSLHFWFVLVLVVATVSGSMLIILLVMLCVENAFVHRLDVAEHKNGLAFIWEAFSEWLQGFNNFRVGFLFMALHDVPISLANFFLLSACRCGGPQVLRWPLFLSVFGTTLSLIWRLVLLYFAYSRLLFPSKNSNNSGFPSRTQSFRNQILNEQNIQTSLETTNNNNNISDEHCPIQLSSALFYGTTKQEGCFCFKCKTKQKTIYLYEQDPGEKRFLSVCCGFWLSCFFFRVIGLLFSLLRRILCIFTSLILFAGYLLLGCTPCLYFYFCRANSLSKRDNLAKSLVRRCSIAFHYFVLLTSLFFSIGLIFTNLILLSSVHLFGPNNWPPEISRVCLSIDQNRQLIHPILMPEQTSLSLPFSSTLNNKLPSQCKSLWDYPHPLPLTSKWTLGMARRIPSQWQARIPLKVDGSLMLAVSTHFISNYTQQRSPQHFIFYDYALLKFGSNSTKPIECNRQKYSGWLFASSKSVQLGFPYFLACSPSIYFRKAALIDCNTLTRRL
uniref:Uncharacterized protein n=1 Tax=Meloidogyne incognita TaxID=6306 RepID=A0A914LUY8_MELIC